MRTTVLSIEAEYRRFKTLAEEAIAQVAEERLGEGRGLGGNSLATLVWHVSGNLASRFTDLLQSDGEKPWRDREGEFAKRSVSRAELAGKWGEGWGILFGALAGLDDGRLGDQVTIRGVALSVMEALLRSLAHVSYHVGQIVFLARELQGERWRYLTIPPGGSAAYNANPVREKPPGPSTVRGVERDPGRAPGTAAGRAGGRRARAEREAPGDRSTGTGGGT